MSIGAGHSLDKGNQLFLLVGLVVNFDHDITAPSQEKHRLLRFHAGLHTLHNVLKLFVGELLRHGFRLKVFLLEQKGCHCCNLSVFVVHCHEESINALIEVADWDLINKFFSLGPALVVSTKQNLDDVV